MISTNYVVIVHCIGVSSDVYSCIGKSRRRNISGPCWNSQLGDFKNFVSILQLKSQKHGWSLCYWSHEAMDAEMQSYAGEDLRDAYFSINKEHMVARSDVCRPWILYKYGGMWLDLRGTPSQDPGDIGLETVPRFFNSLVPHWSSQKTKKKFYESAKRNYYIGNQRDRQHTRITATRPRPLCTWQNARLLGELATSILFVQKLSYTVVPYTTRHFLVF